MQKSFEDIFKEIFEDDKTDTSSSIKTDRIEFPLLDRHFMDMTLNYLNDKKKKPMTNPSFKIPVSTYQRFIRESDKRLGQSFYDFIKAEKMTFDKVWLDRLYSAKDSIASIMITSVIDYTQ